MHELLSLFFVVAAAPGTSLYRWIKGSRILSRRTKQSQKRNRWCNSALWKYFLAATSLLASSS